MCTNQTPNKTLWTICNHVLRYLKGTPSFGIVYRAGGGTKLEAYLDSDWAQKRPNRKSISCYCFKLAEGLIKWRSKKEPIVAQSSKETESIALPMFIRELLWFGELEDVLGEMLEIGEIEKIMKISIAEDNKGCIAVAYSSVHRAHETDRCEISTSGG